MGNNDKRIHMRSAFIGGLVAALTMMALPAVASEVAAALQLGQSNTASTKTTLRGAVGSSNLRIVNTDPDGSPLSLVAEPGNPPLKVNTSKKVANLNADRVDGLSAHQLIRVAHTATDNVDDGIFSAGAANVLTVTVHAPRSGFLVIGSAIDGFGPTDAPDSYICRILVDGSGVTGTSMVSLVDWEAGASGNASENCSTTGAQAVAAGTHTVDLRVTNQTTVIFGAATLWAMYVPFDGDGNRP